VVTFILIANKDDPTSLPATYFPGAENDENNNSPCAVLYKMQEGMPRSLMDLIGRQKMQRTSTSNYLFSEALGKISRVGLEQMLINCFESRRQLVTRKRRRENVENSQAELRRKLPKLIAKHFST
jgi:hypothetical protein